MLDPLPSDVLYNEHLDCSDGTCGWLPSVRTVQWTGAVGVGSPVTIIYQVMVKTDVSEGTIITNTALIQYGGWSFDTPATTTMVKRFRIYLPLIVKNYSPLCNGGFETGDFTCWDRDGEDLPELIVGPAEAHSGDHAVLLGDSNYCNTANPDETGDHRARISQTFTVPFMNKPTLTFWYRIKTYDHILWTDGTLGDSFDVYINSTRILQENYDNSPDPAPGCDSDAWDSKWQQFTYDLTSFKGQEITLRFENVTRVDGWYNTWTYVDDVQIQDVER